MITKNLLLIFNTGTEVDKLTFPSWKKLHMHLFENGLYPEFQVFDDGKMVLHYEEFFKYDTADQDYTLNWGSSVPGSVLFEIVNRHASAKL